jgi:serine/threonine protein kinase
VGFAVENICGFLIRGRLMTPDEMRAMYARWQAVAGGDAVRLDAFLRWLVSSGYVTEYQAGLLAQGHADDFFLNQYKILERIGRGRMAGVFKAVHTLGQIVAIKVLPPSRAKNTQLLARFQREARLSLRLKHPNVVRSFQVGEAHGVHYLVMEHLEGEPLDEILRRRRTLPVEEAVRLAHQTLLGLQHIHEQGMVHRDIKPANLFLVNDGPLGRPVSDSPTVKILDIGLAREFFEESPPPGQPGWQGGLELTAEGVLLGTPDYLAPEQARDPRRSDIRADIYSVGCVLYHMLAGQTPFPDKNLFNQIVRHATEAHRPLREFNPTIKEGLEQIISWMMAKQPDQRYPTPARAAQALEVMLLVGNGAAAPAEEPPQMRKFLTWLEKEESISTNEPAPAVTPIPAMATPVMAAATPAKPPPPAAAPTMAPNRPGPNNATPSAPRSGAIRKASPPVPQAKPTPTPQPQFDVELVPVMTKSISPPRTAVPKAMIILIVSVVGLLSFGCGGILVWLGMWLWNR